MSERVAVYCSTRNGYNTMATAAKSLIAHDGADRIFFLTEDDAFPDPPPPAAGISCINVSGQTWFDPDGPNYSTKWTWMVLMRAALSKVFPQYDRVLSLDTDTIVNGDISQLWNVNIDGYYLAGVREGFGNRKNFPGPYYNFGVALINLAQLRADGMDDKIIHDINTVQHDYNEQDSINFLCYGKIRQIPEEYNSMPGNKPEVPLGHERIRHFIFDKPLVKHEMYRRYRRMSWEEVLCIRENVWSLRTFCDSIGHIAKVGEQKL